MNKKTYEQPVMKVVEIEEAAIIAQSTQTDGFKIKSGAGYSEEEW